MKKYKPCPFCGSISIKLVTNKAGDDPLKHRFYVKCNNCHSRGPVISGTDASTHACAMWNGEEIATEKLNSNQVTLEEIC